jgi:hypothetical protein
MRVRAWHQREREKRETERVKGKKQQQKKCTYYLWVCVSTSNMMRCCCCCCDGCGCPLQQVPALPGFVGALPRQQLRSSSIAAGVSTIGTVAEQVQQRSEAAQLGTAAPAFAPLLHHRTHHLLWDASTAAISSPSTSREKQRQREERRRERERKREPATGSRSHRQALFGTSRTRRDNGRWWRSALLPAWAASPHSRCCPQCSARMRCTQGLNLSHA